MRGPRLLAQRTGLLKEAAGQLYRYGGLAARSIGARSDVWITRVTSHRPPVTFFPMLTAALARAISPHQFETAAAPAAQERPIMFCSRCGIRVEEGNRFCQACGQEVGAAVATAPSSTVYSGPSGASARTSTPLQYGGFWVRFAAFLIDGLILGIPLGALALVLIFLFGGFGTLIHMNPGDPGAARAFAATMIPILFL